MFKCIKTVFLKIIISLPLRKLNIRAELCSDIHLHKNFLFIFYYCGS